MVSFNDVRIKHGVGSFLVSAFQHSPVYTHCSPPLQIHYTSLFLGIIGAGGCFSGANPGYTVQELTHHVRITGAKYILTAPKTLDISIAAAEKCGIPLSKVFVLDFYQEVVREGHQSWNTLLEHDQKDWVAVEDPDNTPAAYVSTSGTSGLPKAAIISHSYFVFQGEYQDRISMPRYKVCSPSPNRYPTTQEADEIGVESDSHPALPRLHHASPTRAASAKRNTDIYNATLRKTRVRECVGKVRYHAYGYGASDFDGAFEV